MMKMMMLKMKAKKEEEEEEKGRCLHLGEVFLSLQISARRPRKMVLTFSPRIGDRGLPGMGLTKAFSRFRAGHHLIFGHANVLTKYFRRHPNRRYVIVSQQSGAPRAKPLSGWDVTSCGQSAACVQRWPRLSPRKLPVACAARPARGERARPPEWLGRGATSPCRRTPPEFPHPLFSSRSRTG